MDKTIKMLIDMTIDEDIKDFLLKSSNGNKINTNEVYLAHTVFISKEGIPFDEEYRIVIDSSIKTPHNKFFIDILNRESIGILNGYTGFSMTDNDGRCIDKLDTLSKKMVKQVTTFSEIKEFLRTQNKKFKTRKK